MPTPRKNLIDHQSVGYYHIITKCVRQASLCGTDVYTKKNYDYRKQWVKDRLVYLSQFFYIDIGAYAIMSNHMHIVLRNRPDLEQEASDYEVVKRYLCVYTGVEASLEGRYIPLEEEIKVILRNPIMINKIRERISSISWFMRSLNEWLSKRANKEDGCKGRFWEGRFKSQHLSDHKAVLLCSAYVDLNPVRAFQCDLPENAEFTSFKERVQSYPEKDSGVVKAKNKCNSSLVQKDILNAKDTVKKETFSWLSGFREAGNSERNPFFEISEKNIIV